MLKFTTTLSLAATAWLFAACSSEPTCDYSEEPYIIPPPSEGAKPVPTGKGRCLDRPPSYFSTAPDKKDADKKDGKESDKQDKKDK
jgi:hypothetical protein